MKKFGLFLTAVAAVMFVAATSNAALISLFEFDEGTGSTASNAISSVGSGTLSGTATWATGYIGTGAYNGGTGGGYVDILGTTVQEFTPWGTNSTAFWTGTYSLWINTGVVAQSEITFQKMKYADGAGIRGTIVTGMNASPGYWEGMTFTGSTYAYRKTSAVAGMGTGTGNAQDGNWHLVTISYNLTTGASGTGSMSWYLDGELKSSGAYSTNKVTSASTWGATSEKRLFTNLSSDTTSNPLPGLADDNSVWNTRLSNDEVRALYNLGKDTLILDGQRLAFGAENAAALFDLFAGPAGGTATIGGLTWQKVDSGLGSVGGTIYAEGGVKGLNLGGSTGAGLQIVPEPGTISLLLAGAIGLLVFAWRKRK